MIYIGQFGIILLITFAGELLNYFIPLPIPASIYGFIIMLLALKFRIVKLRHIQHTAEFLIGIITLMFVPAAVGLIDVWGVLEKILLPLVIITVITTVFVMVVTGRVTQLLIRLDRGKK
ncbi:MAG: CidA/LrgA family protein [Oscillospiraceae bacterium]